MFARTAAAALADDQSARLWQDVMAFHPVIKSRSKSALIPAGPKPKLKVLFARFSQSNQETDKTAEINPA